MPLSSKSILQQPGITQPPTSNEDSTHHETWTHSPTYQPRPVLQFVPLDILKTCLSRRQIEFRQARLVLVQRLMTPQMEPNTPLPPQKADWGENTSKKKTTIKFETKEK